MQALRGMPDEALVESARAGELDAFNVLVDRYQGAVYTLCLRILGERGAAVGSILGSVVGGIAGNAAEQTATRQAGYEITVRLDGGRVIAVTQATDERFSPGDRVRVLSDGVTARVTR